MKVWSTILFLLFSQLVFSQEKLNLIPYPQKLEMKAGNFQLNDKTVVQGIYNSFEYNYFLSVLKSRYNLDLSKNRKKEKDGNIIYLTSLNKEKKVDYNFNKNNTYEINVGKYAILKGKTEEGLFQAIQTFLQLVQKDKNGKLSVPFVSIEDSPKFDYRGMHLDVARHFFTVDEVKKYLDYLAMYKYNKFHWHLTDDQGWRIEIKKYPRLTEIGAWRNGSQVGHYSDMKFDDKKYGGFYTQEQIKEVVEYAKKLHIDIIPEIEMPGHSVAAIASYPELSCINGNFEVSKKWGVEDNILCPTEKTFQFLEDVIDEVVELFPYEYIHIGGDEAPKKYWKESEFVQKRIKELGLKDEHEMQSYFITRMERYINQKGKKIIGWNEILEGGLAPNATVMSWTGIEGGIEAAKTGHKAVMTPTSTNYFDYYQGNPETEPIAIGGDVRLNKVYNYNPIPKELNENEAKFIWGTQGNLWTEYISDFKHVEHMIFPRMMALSEVAWGTSDPSNYKDFEKRIVEHFKILGQLKINYSKAIFEVSGKIEQGTNNEIFYELSSAKPNNYIHFTTDGTEPNTTSSTYEKPLPINKSTELKAAVFENNQKISATISQKFEFSKSTGKNITLQNPPSEAYSVGGSFSLVDGVKGNIKNHGKSWLGFSGKDVVATIDLGKIEEISSVNFGSLDRSGSWIYLPKSVKISVSNDGKNFKEVAEIGQAEIAKSNGNIDIKFANQITKFIKIEIENFGIIPDGKEGAGNPSWLFIDEISVN